MDATQKTRKQKERAVMLLCWGVGIVTAIAVLAFILLRKSGPRAAVESETAPSTAATEAVLPTQPEAPDYSAYFEDFSEVWSADYPYGSTSWCIDLAFEQDGTVYCGLGVYLSEYDVMTCGSYSIRDGVIEFRLDLGEGEKTYSFLFDSENRQMTQLSDNGFYTPMEKGYLLEFHENEWFNADRFREMYGIYAEANQQNQSGSSYGVLNEAALENARASLNVPEGLEVSFRVSNLCYWPGALVWYVPIEIIHDGQVVASAGVDPLYGNPISSIWTYSGDSYSPELPERPEAIDLTQFVGTWKLDDNESAEITAIHFGSGKAQVDYQNGTSEEVDYHMESGGILVLGGERYYCNPYWKDLYLAKEPGETTSQYHLE